MRNDKGFTLVDLLVLLLIAGVFLILALPNMAMARNRARLQDTLQQVQAVAAGVEAGRAEFPQAEYAARVNQLNNLEYLTAEECPWLVPEFLSPRGLKTPWGGRIVFRADPLTGQVKVGAPGKKGKLDLSLDTEPFLYPVRSTPDFDRGVVFRNGVMIIGPQAESSRP